MEVYLTIPRLSSRVAGIYIVLSVFVVCMNRTKLCVPSWQGGVVVSGGALP